MNDNSNTFNLAAKGILQPVGATTFTMNNDNTFNNANALSIHSDFPDLNIFDPKKNNS